MRIVSFSIALLQFLAVVQGGYMGRSILLGIHVFLGMPALSLSLRMHLVVFLVLSNLYDIFFQVDLSLVLI